MNHLVSSFLAAAGLVITAAAHSHIDYVTVNGLVYPGYIPKLGANNTAETVGWAQTALDDGFVPPSDYASPDIICHRNGSPARAHVPVSPGDKIHMQWNGWPASHAGPILSYLAPCDSASATNGSDGCASVDKTRLEFTKIDDAAPVFFNESGGPPGFWSTNTLIANNNSWLVGLPTALAPGAYVLRHELIALHYANRPDGAQNYPQCINLWVTAGAGQGSGTAVRSARKRRRVGGSLRRRGGGQLATELYHADDPGISIDIYRNLTAYKIPGPALASGAEPVPVASQSNMQSRGAGTPVLVSGKTAVPFPKAAGNL